MADLITQRCGCTYISREGKWGPETELHARCDEHEAQQDRINQLLKPPSRRRGRRKKK